jgi:uncharacterized protein YjbI with pentapeptide repeats
MSTPPKYLSVFESIDVAVDLQARGDLRGSSIAGKVLLAGNSLADSSVTFEGLVLYRCVHGATPPAQSISLQSDTAPSLEALLLSHEGLGRSLRAKVRSRILSKPQGLRMGFDLRHIPLRVYLHTRDDAQSTSLNLDVDLSQSMLRGVDLWSIPQLMRCSFEMSDLQETRWGSAWLRECVFDGADLRHSEHELVKFGACSFARADMSHAQFDGCVFIACDFQGANVSGGVMRNCIFLACEGIDALALDSPRVLAGLVMSSPPPTKPSQARREAFQFLEAVGLGGEHMAQVATQIDASQFDFRDVDLGRLEARTIQNVNFRGCSFSGASFPSSGFVEFVRCDFSDAVLDDAFASSLVFKQCEMRGVSLRALDCEDVTFDDCELSGVSFDGIKAKRYGFSDCNLTGASFVGSRIAQLSFTQCDMHGVSLQNAQLQSLGMLTSAVVDAQLSGIDAMSIRISRCTLLRVDARNIRTDLLILTGGGEDVARIRDMVALTFNADADGFPVVSVRRNRLSYLRRLDPGARPSPRAYAVCSLEFVDLRGARCTEVRTGSLSRDGVFFFFDHVTTDESSANIMTALAAEDAFTRPE